MLSLACGVLHGKAPSEHYDGSMKESIVRDRSNNRVGSIVQRGDHFMARDGSGNTVGYYDPKKNVTTDRNGNRLNEGNTLAVLIFNAGRH